MGQFTTPPQDSYELERRIRDALNSAKMALWELNLTEGTLQWTGRVTPHFFEFANSIDGTISNYVSLIHAEDLNRVLGILEKTKVGESFVNQHRVKFPTGNYHWLEGIGTLIQGQDGLKLTGTVQDISDKKKLEFEREDWKQKHELVAKSAGIVVYEYDLGSGELSWNGDTEGLFGFMPSEMKDIESWEKRIHKGDRADVLQILDSAREKMAPYEIQYRFIQQDGTFAYVQDKGIFLGNSKANRMLGMLEDVSEYRKSEFALKESEGRFKSMISDMNIGIGLYDENTAPILCNRQAYELLGMSEKQYMGQAALDKSWKALKEDGSVLKNDEFPIPVAIRTKKHVRDFIMAVFRPERNDWVWLMVDAVPVFSKERELMHVICTFSDITGLRAAQASLGSRNEMLSNLSEELQTRNDRLLEFAQIVSHNLRSPISSIVSLSKIVMDGPDQIVKEAAISHIAKVSENALLTIDELNDVLKVQQENLEREELSFQSILGHVKNSHQGDIMEANAQIHHDFEVLEIEFAKIYLESIFSNFLSNSLKYRSNIDKCQIWVRTFQNENQDVILEWEDNGIGIDLERHGDDIFNLGKTFHENSDSRGVGLFLVKNQVSVMGGSISIESEPGKGTKFMINFTNYRNSK